MSLMGLQAIYPKLNMSRKRHDHKIYPYLLRDVEIVHPDQVWSTDITYIRMKGGFEVSNRNHRLRFIGMQGMGFLRHGNIYHPMIMIK